ncbi:ionotropic receptor 75a-like [Uranotaenia lowii]|uniref:ionotropic receptor 75a-like n=1 Tax=Uranotaenia lowii TaxID=190385 RepID=UPI00247A1DDE|nr:ionotropic receptor 75a-like [Uranotaenia lowii]
MRHDYINVGSTVDLSCPKVGTFFDVISEMEYFNASHSWLMFGEGSLEPLSCLLDKQNFNVDAKVTLVAPDEVDRKLYNVYDVYSVMRKRGTKLNITLMGYWKLEDGLRIVVNETEYERRVDFGGIWLKGVVSDLHQANHTSLVDHLLSRDTVTGYALHRYGYIMWQFVMKKHNFTLKLIRTPSWGMTNTDGHSHEGMIGQLAAHEVDVCVNALAYKKERIETFDYTVTVGMSKRLFVFRHPRFGQSRNVFLQPFRVELWMALTALSLLSAALLYGTCYAESLQAPHDKEIRDNRSQSLLNVLGILCQQGFLTRTLFNSTRINLFSMLLFSFLIYQFYSTYIVGYLLIIPPKFMTLLEHLLQSNLKILIEDIAYNIDYLNRTTDPVAVELYQKKILNGERNFLNVTEGIERIKEGGSAFLFDTAYGYPLISQTFTDHEICDLQEIYLYPIRPVHLPLVKGSPFKEMFRITMRKVVETSVAQYQQKFFFTERPKCSRSDLETTPVILEHVASLFLTLLYSILASGAILMAEIGLRLVKKRFKEISVKVD